MKLLVFSDSHSNYKNIKEAISLQRGSLDGVIFLGDGVRDIEKIKNEYSEFAFFIVKGNCDFMINEYEAERVLDLDGTRLLITHGHLYSAKSGYARLAYRARELEADAVLFGHTHQPCDDILEIHGKSIRLFNPGSIGYSGTFGVLNISGGVIVTNHGKLY